MYVVTQVICVLTFDLTDQELVIRVCQCVTLENGMDSAASPLGMVQIPGLCQSVSPCVSCVSTSFSPTPVSRVTQLTQGDTGWHTRGIRTIPKGEAAESIPFSRVTH